MTTESSKFKGWCVVELMGHVTLAGFVSEQEIAGSALIRIDVPETDAGPAFTKMVGTGSVYGITPVDEQAVRAICSEGAQRPFSAWQLQSAFEKYYESRLKTDRPRIEDEVRRQLTADNTDDEDYCGGCNEPLSACAC